MPHTPVPTVRRARIGAALALLGALGACAEATPTATRSGATLVSAGDTPACTAEYAAVLDLAALARSYGAGAGLFMDALGTQFDQLDQCLTAHGTPGVHDARGRLSDGLAMPIAVQKLIRP